MSTRAQLSGVRSSRRPAWDESSVDTVFTSLEGSFALLGMLRRGRRTRIGERHLKRLLRSRADHWFRRQSRGTFDAGQNDHHDNSDGRAEHDARCLEIGHLDDRTQPDDRQ